MTVTDPKTTARIINASRESKQAHFITPRIMELHYFGDCASPVQTTLWGRRFREAGWDDTYEWMNGIIRKRVDPSSVLYLLRCRKCEPCRRARQSMWKTRALREVEAAARTWFVTLTASPESHVVMEYSTIERLRKAGCCWSGPCGQCPTGHEGQILCRPGQHYLRNKGERFTEITKTMGREVTLWIKRIRKATGVTGIRYMLVFEAHKSGRPHVHALFFEPHGSAGMLTKRSITDAWRLGFSHAKLLTEPKQITYVTKYLNKEFGTIRLRASRRFGEGPITPSGVAKRDFPTEKGSDPPPPKS